MSDVLFLNADYTPLQIAPLSTINWKESIKLYWLQQIDVIEYYDHWFVHSPSITLQVPSVIVTKTYVKTTRSVKFNKTNLCIRDEYTCQYCGKHLDSKTLTMEHVIPRSRGGKTNWTNIVCACNKCNTLKSDRLDMKPASEPRKPTYGEIVTKAKRFPLIIPDVKWIPYISWPPKNVKIKNIQGNLDFHSTRI